MCHVIELGLNWNIGMMELERVTCFELRATGYRLPALDSVFLNLKSEIYNPKWSNSTIPFGFISPLGIREDERLLWGRQ